MSDDTSVEKAIETRAREQLARDELRQTGPRRTSQSLGATFRAFWRHPSPWLISAFLGGAVLYRASVPSFGWSELLVPVVLVACFPLIEWVVHVVVLHWRPRTVGPVAVDSLLSRKHREHHADPRLLPLVFIPWQAELWLIPSYVGIAWLVFPRAVGATFLVTAGALMLGYEWVHYLVHSDYRPRTAPTGRCGATTGFTTTRTSATGSRSPRRGRQTDSSAPVPTRPPFPRHRPCGVCTTSRRLTRPPRVSSPRRSGSRRTRRSSRRSRW